MTHAFDFRAAPRVALLPAVALFLVGGSVVVAALVHLVAGLGALVVSAWFSYHLVRFTVRHLGSHVRTSNDGLASATSFGEELQMAWEELTHAGVFVTARNVRYLFAYNEARDQLLTIPPYYARLDELESELRRHAPLMLELAGERAEDLASALRPYLDG